MEEISYLKILGITHLEENTATKREIFLKHKAVFLWNRFSSSEYHLLHKYIATKVTSRNIFKKK